MAVAEPRFADAFLSGTATPVIQTDNWLLPIKANPVSIDINEVFITSCTLLFEDGTI